MIGAAVIALAVLPRLLDAAGLPISPWLASLASVVQTGAYLGLAVWAGVRLGPRVGLKAAAFAAAAAGRRLWPALRPQLVPGLIGAAAGGSIILTAGLLEPGDLAAVADELLVPLPARILYGGITEELLIRFGLMSTLAWLFWRLLQRRRGRPSAALFWAAIVCSAIPFGVGHLPLVAAAAGGLTAEVAIWVVGGNAVLGVVAGYLFWRHGLESAMIAHSLAHVFDYSVRLAFPL